VIYPEFLSAQFPPPAGQPGSTAIHRDSSIIIDWADDCQVSRGYIDLSDTNITYNGSNRASYGSYLYAYGPSDEYVVSLGDNGSAVLVFDPPISDGQGADFAVFENSFGDLFLELAFVEVSSDGLRFIRFPAYSNVSESIQIPTFGTLDATLIHNFAGKYRSGFGTPFDLSDIKDSIGINVNHITHVRIVDAGGCINPLFATFDSQGHKVNDPWPTPFDTGGFDLDAIGVIHNTLEGEEEQQDFPPIRFYPNPFTGILNLDPGTIRLVRYKIYTAEGQMVTEGELTGHQSINLEHLSHGIYFAELYSDHGPVWHIKLIKK
jgi:hypothetical protein